eukprot:2901601-Amphidinium_carterae.1
MTVRQAVASHNGFEMDNFLERRPILAQVGTPGLSFAAAVLLESLRTRTYITLPLEPPLLEGSTATLSTKWPMGEAPHQQRVQPGSKKWSAQMRS